MRRVPKHAGSPADQARIARRTLGRAEARQRDERLDAVDRDLLNVIDRLTVLAYGDGRIGVPKLAEQVHRTPRTVRRHLRRLECLGYLEVGEREAAHGGPAVNRYRVLTPRDRGAGGWARRRAARDERDRARKTPRRASGRGVLTRTAPAHTRGRVNARSGTGEVGRQRPTVPVGQAERTGADMPMRVERWTSRQDEHGTWVTPKPLGGEPGGRTADPGRGRGDPLPPVRAGRVDPAEQAAEVEAAQARIAELVARGRRVSARRSA